MSRLAVAALAAVLAAGCAGVDERHAEQMMLGQQYYNNGKFYDSIGRFTSAWELASSGRERYQAMLGVANASAEYGLQVYEAAESLLRNKNYAAGKKKWQEADKWHDDATKAFYKCLEMRPDDTIANVGLGNLFYKRATSFTVLPFTESKEGVVARQKERDEAVRQFQIVLKSERGDITMPDHGPRCQSPHIHRYLGLALFTRSDWDRNDLEEARRHMMVYLNYLKWALRSISESNPPSDNPDQAKLEKEARLERVRRQIGETRFLLGDQLKGLKEVQAFWQRDKTIEARLKEIQELLARGKDDRTELLAEREKLQLEEKKLPPKEKREDWMNAAKREIAALQNLDREFEEAAKASKTKPKPSSPAPEQNN
jgi:hypothetical protein